MTRPNLRPRAARPTPSAPPTSAGRTPAQAGSDRPGDAPETDRPAARPRHAATPIPHPDPGGAGGTAGTGRASRWAGDPDEADDAYDGDGDAESDHEPSRPTRPGHRVMDAAEITRALQASGFDGTFDSLSKEEEQRVRSLLQHRDGDLFRPHLIGGPAMVARLDALDRGQPNFAAATKLVRRAVHLSHVAGAPIRIQPTVLLGSPGVGKSRYARALADALGTPCTVINGASLPDVGSLTGYPPVWRGAGPGRIAKSMIASTTSAPVIFVDEAEKIDDFEAMAHPLDRLLAVLEPTTAAAYQDENLQVPMRAQHAVLLFACNALDGLSEPFLDRVVTLRIPDLGRDQRDAVLAAMLGEVADALGLPVSLADGDALAPLRSLGLRRSRLAFEIAIGRAVEQGRRFLTAPDLAEAVAVLAGPDRARPIGFVHPRA